MKGRVIKSTGSWYLVQTDQGILSARLKGKFKQDELKLTNPIAVGDWVALEKEEGQESAVIHEIFPRENYVIRKSTRKQHFSHMIASNIDQAILVITMKKPRTSLGFIDRFLVVKVPFEVPRDSFISMVEFVPGNTKVVHLLLLVLLLVKHIKVLLRWQLVQMLVMVYR